MLPLREPSSARRAAANPRENRRMVSIIIVVYNYILTRDNRRMVSIIIVVNYIRFIITYVYIYIYIYIYM